MLFRSSGPSQQRHLPALLLFLPPHSLFKGGYLFELHSPLCSRLAARSLPLSFPLGDSQIILLSVRHTVIEVETGEGVRKGEEREQEEEEGGGRIIFSYLSEMMT